MFDYLRKTSIINFEGVYHGQHKLLWLGIEFFHLITKIFLNIVYTVSMDGNQLERLSWKTAYAIILANNTKWVSSQLFVCGRAKLGPLGREHLHYLMFITELLLVWPIGNMDPHITDWVTKPSQVPWTGNLVIYQIVTHFSFLLTYFP